MTMIKSGVVALLTAAVLGASAAVHAQTFGYFGDVGPIHWGDLSTDWTACKDGRIQSPVDLGHPQSHPPVRHQLDIDYGRTSGEIFNNGHTIEVETEGENTLTINGVDYELTQFHFHNPSEHRINGRGYDMELHLVHTSADGSNAVIGVFLERGPRSGSLAPIFANLPDDLNVKHPLPRLFNPATFLPRSLAHYRFFGSLTTPPCTEGVRWIVMRDPVTVSDEDMAQFAERIHFNARFVQREFR